MAASAYRGSRQTRHMSLATRFLCLALAGAGLVATADNARAATPQQLCLQSGSASVASDADLSQATAAAEQLLVQAEADFALGDLALEKLVVADAPGGIISPLVLAAYCNAAGEAMRVARSGSENRARSYLLTALALTEQAQAAPLRAQISYRLALVSRNLAVRPNARSAQRSISNEEQPLALPPAQDNRDSDDKCSLLLRTRLDDQSNWAASRLALECSIASAFGPQADEIIALSQLQLARITLTEAERRAASRSELRQIAGTAALDGLTSAANLADPGECFDISARLIESAISAGMAGDPRIAAVLTGLWRVQSGDPGEAAMLHALQGQVMQHAGDTVQATALFRRAIFFESQRPQPLRLGDWYLLLAGADTANREVHVMHAYEALQAIRPLLPTIDPVTKESTFALRMQPVFSAAVDVQLSQSGSGQEVQRILAAQKVVESFRQAEIQYVFGADCVPPRIPISPADLRVGEILLYPILLQDRVELLYAAKTREGEEPRYQRFTQADGADLDSIDRLVKTAVFELGYGIDDSWQLPTAELYRIFIQPIEDLLGPDATLVIVPDGILRRLPFAALRDPSGTLLIEKTRISVAPSLAYTQPGSDNDKKTSIVAASLSEAVDLPAGSFAALAGTSSEAKMASGMGDPDHPRGIHLDNFRRSDLELAFAGQPIDILHLATHASFNGRSDRSFIVADDQAILLSDLREIIGRNRASGELLSLIILSACETALGDDQASMGLAGSAVQAGAESAIASLWEVDDAGTAELMQKFYLNFAQGKGKAEALRDAQLALIRNDGVFNDPRIWAAFTLLGAWR